MIRRPPRSTLFPYTTSSDLLEALTTLQVRLRGLGDDIRVFPTHGGGSFCGTGDRKSTRLNSSHTVISYAVFCLKKKKTTSNSDLTTKIKIILLYKHTI